MQPRFADTRGARRRPSRDVLTRQMIVCAVAFCIMCAGVWILVSGPAPYHPEDYSVAPDDKANEVSRGTGRMSVISDGN